MHFFWQDAVQFAWPLPILLVRTGEVPRTGDRGGHAPAYTGASGLYPAARFTMHVQSQKKMVISRRATYGPSPFTLEGVMPAVPSDGLLIGRDDELAALMGYVGEVRGGQGGRAVLIEGEPGIGKSSLVRAACAEAIGLGCQVFWGAGDELGQTFPLLPFLDGLRVRESIPDKQRETILALLRGETASGRGEGLPAALTEQLIVLVDELCATLPAVLVIDDLQWADHASVSLWERLARSGRHRPLLLVGMMRPVPQQEDLLALRAHADLAARVQLDALDEDAVVELVTALA